jgi:hypothetical protein
MNRAPWERGLLWARLWRLAVAGLTFVLVYGYCNTFTSTRENVGTWFWEWERRIPFVKEMVVPYWSLDLFFVGAFFVCSNKAELNLLTKRLVAVVVASGLCFLLFPLKMGFDRPVPSGWTAPLFHALYANDMPYNLAPSLHISLRSLVWIVYGAHLTGLTRKVGKVWFMLISLSTLLVWQHHVIDVATGFMMGWLIAVLIPDPRFKTERTPSTRLALRYGAGAVACAGLAFLWFGFAWPALALGIVALAYGTGWARVLGKENGTLSPSAEWCLLPVVVVTWLYQRRWLKRDPGWCEITPGVFFGRKLAVREAKALLEKGPLAVLDLTAESNAPTVFRERAWYRSLPLLDLVKPADVDVAKAVAFIREQRLAERRVYVHCQLGLQRSALVVAHWLVENGGARDLAGAKAIVHTRVPEVVLG